jgi:hypothetical protein
VFALYSVSLSQQMELRIDKIKCTVNQNKHDKTKYVSVEVKWELCNKSNSKLNISIPAFEFPDDNITDSTVLKTIYYNKITCKIISKGDTLLPDLEYLGYIEMPFPKLQIEILDKAKCKSETYHLNFPYFTEGQLELEFVNNRNRNQNIRINQSCKTNQ